VLLLRLRNDPGLQPYILGGGFPDAVSRPGRDSLTGSDLLGLQRPPGTGKADNPEGPPTRFGEGSCAGRRRRPGGHDVIHEKGGFRPTRLRACRGSNAPPHVDLPCAPSESGLRSPAREAFQDRPNRVSESGAEWLGEQLRLVEAAFAEPRPGDRNRHERRWGRLKGLAPHQAEGRFLHGSPHASGESRPSPVLELANDARRAGFQSKRRGGAQATERRSSAGRTAPAFGRGKARGSAAGAARWENPREPMPAGRAHGHGARLERARAEHAARWENDIEAASGEP